MPLVSLYDRQFIRTESIVALLCDTRSNGKVDYYVHTNANSVFINKQDYDIIAAALETETTKESL